MSEIETYTDAVATAIDPDLTNKLRDDPEMYGYLSEIIIEDWELHLPSRVPSIVARMTAGMDIANTKPTIATLVSVDGDTLTVTFRGHAELPGGALKLMKDVKESVTSTGTESAIV